MQNSERNAALNGGNELITQVGINKFTPSVQEDAGEFFLFLIHSLGASLQHWYRAARVWHWVAAGQSNGDSLSFERGQSNRGIKEHFTFRTVKFEQTDWRA